MAIPNLETFVFSTRGNCGDQSLSVASTGTTADGVQAPTTATATCARFDTIALSGQFTKYRVVAYGARVRVVSGLETAGEFTFAAMPLKGIVNPSDTNKPAIAGQAGASTAINSYYGASGPRATMEGMLYGLGIPFSGSANTAVVDITKLVNIPTHALVTAAEAAARGIHLRGLPFESAAREFRSVTFTSIGTDSADLVFNSGTQGSAPSAVTSMQYGLDLSAYRVGGHESLLLGGSGFPASTTVGSLELIYHVEAVPNPSYSTLARPTGVVPTVPPSETLDSVLTKLHRMPRISFSDVLTSVGDSVLGDVEGRVAGAAGAGLTTLAGTLGRLLIAAV